MFLEFHSGCHMNVEIYMAAANACYLTDIYDASLLRTVMMILY